MLRDFDGGAGAGALGAGSACDHAALDANSETAPATINPAGMRILFSLNSNPAPVAALPASGGSHAPILGNLVAAAAPTQRLRPGSRDL